MKIVDGICVISEKSSEGVSGEKLLESMDANGIESAVICCDNRHAAVDCNGGNAYIKELTDTYPARFHGFATASPWLGGDGESEIRRRLWEGFEGVFFNPVAQGFMADDEMVYPLVEACEEYGAPVYFHTGTPMQALPFQVLSLAKKYPKVNFIIGHMGANDYVGDAFAAAGRAENIYLETSLNLTVNMRSAAKLYSGRMIFGSSMPESLQSFELKKLRQAVSDDERLEKILAGNLTSLLGVKNDD